MEKKVSPAKVVVLGEGIIVHILHLMLSEGRKNFNYSSIRAWTVQRELKDHCGCYLHGKVSLRSSIIRYRLIKAGGQTLKMIIWDTAGQERYHALNQVYYRGAEGKILFIKDSGAIVVYDGTDSDTFKKMNQWVSELR